jgi:putative ABC transport system ATP-binding protein
LNLRLRCFPQRRKDAKIIDILRRLGCGSLALRLCAFAGNRDRKKFPTNQRSVPLLEAKDLSKIYQMGSTTVAALDHVSMAVNAGEFIAIQGTSGSGKSTLLNVLGGLDHATSGEVLFDSKSLAPLNKREMARYRRYSVGMIFQNFNLITTMSAEENVGLALAFAGLRGPQRKSRAQELLDRVGLSDRLTHRPTELSGGEQQRVAIARALANRPRVLLADEPTGNLDSTRAHELLALLREMVGEDGLTVLIVTHDHELANTFADRIILMKDGRVERMKDEG